MSESTETAAPPAEAAQPDEKPAQPEQPKPQPPAEETDWKAEARKWEQRAKENKKAAEELDRQRKASMTEAERAVVEAEQRGRMAAVTDFGKRLARTEFDAAAARRNPKFDTASALDFIDLAKFVGDDGEPDRKAIQAAVDRLVPEAKPAAPSFDGGTRTPSAPGTNMNDIIRAAARR